MKQLKLIHFIFLLCLFVLAFSTHSIASQKDGLLKIYFLDVGQGDAIFIEMPNGNQILIDGGPDNKILSELADTMPFYDRDIDVVVATHTHADHITGLAEVLKRYDVANVIESGDKNISPIYGEWEKIIKEEDANYTKAIAGEIIDMGDETTLTVLTPLKSYDGVILKNSHEANVTILLQYKSFRVLLAGDMEIPLERQLLLSGGDVSADVLKVGHHGSKTSSGELFLSAVHPKLGFIEVGGGNQYGLPAPAILSRLENFGIKYYRTDIDGSIKIVSDGTNYQLIPNY